MSDRSVGIARHGFSVSATLVAALALFLIPFLFDSSPSGQGAPDGSDPFASLSEIPSVGLAGPTVPPDWYEAVTDRIARSEYDVSRAAEGLQAPNRAQDLRTYFREGGIDVLPRRAMEADWTWSWRTRAWGRLPDEDACTASFDGIASLDLVASREPIVDCFRVSYAQDGFTEWYENRPSGIEQGFTIEHRPAGDGLLCFEGALGGHLTPRLHGDTAGVEFVDATGQTAFDYDGLLAYDATGRELPAHLECGDDFLRILVDDAGAMYPCVIDPILTTPSWTVSGTQTDARLGYSASTAGDVNGDGYSDIIVGANGYDHGEANEGRVWVYLGSSDGLEASPAWSAEANQANAYLGYHVATAGDVNGDGYDDVLAVAMYYGEDFMDEGVAWLWMGSEDGPEADPSWERLGGQYSAQINMATMAGDVNADGYADVLVSAHSYMDTYPSEGKVWLFLGSGSGLSTTPAWSKAGGQEGAFFGMCIAAAGDVNGNGYDDVIIGASRWDAGQIDEGRAFLYYGSPTGLNGTSAWSHESNQTGAHYGDCVAGAGDVNGDGYADLLVSAHLYNSGDLEEGRVELFLGGNLGPSTSPDWSIDGNAEEEWMGYKLSTAGDVNGDGFADVLVTAQRYYTDIEQDRGEVHLFLGSWSGLSLDPVWTTDGDLLDAKFGSALATAGDVNGDGYSDILVGAPNYSTSLHLGKVFVYHGAPDGPRETAGWVTESNQTDATYGISVAYAGDVDGDGRTDVLVGATGYDNGQVDEGAAFLFLGTAQGLSAIPAWWAESNQAGSSFGRCVASAGDVNGDGLDDVVIGAPRYDNSFTDEGAAFVWMSAPGGIPYGNPTNADWTRFGGQDGAQLGWSVSTAGNVNGDAYSDLIVGAYLYDNGQSNEGAAWVYHGSASGLSTTSNWFRDSAQSSAYFGVSVAHAGDFNGDGYSDVIVGASRFTSGQSLEGFAFLYTGSSSGLSAGAPYWYGEANQASARLGSSVASAGDVNGDGYSDILVGAPYYDNPTLNGGTAYLWYGTPTAPVPGNPDNADWASGRQQEDALYGTSVSSAGDVNGDGYSDILVGCPNNDGTPGVDAGMVALWYGSADGPYPVAAGWIAEGSAANGNFGFCVAGNGDVNGDGYSDILVGAHDYTNGQTEEGRSFVYYGNDSRGLSRDPRQATSTLSHVIAPLGRSNSETAIGLGLRGRSPAGRGEVRIEWELAPHGTSFDGVADGVGSWHDTNTPASSDGSYYDIARSIGGLYAGTPYHWRARVGGKNPYFPRSPWLHLPFNGETEMDFRTGGTPSGVDPDPVTAVLSLSASPNPFTEITSIRFALPEAVHVRLGVFDVQGRRVGCLLDAERAAGPFEVTWTGRDGSQRPLPGGVYFVRLEIHDHVRTLRVVRLE
ncbi:MAG: FG-GAP repeat protein [Candidatus Eisenbacteria bacterium]|uniref:FG-GAP repeat protein n=1 Tax=Eiseniibacteriota bacterium TaxID=2212470 RepID=A0A956NDC6_UNCEI|nr:FG-GAP repeat protein [Candidatus Eisenbacteria bacterium]